MAKLAIPSVNKLIGFGVTMMAFMFVLRFLPENIRGLFRI